MWFVWEMKQTGYYAPCLYGETPGNSPAGTSTPKRKGLVKLKEDEQHLQLKILARIYPLDA